MSSRDEVWERFVPPFPMVRADPSRPSLSEMMGMLPRIPTPPRSLARDIDDTRARLTDTLAAHDSRDMPEDVWTALADAHHYLTAADAYLRRSQDARVVIDDE